MDVIHPKAQTVFEASKDDNGGQYDEVETEKVALLQWGYHPRVKNLNVATTKQPCQSETWYRNRLYSQQRTGDKVP